MRLPYIGRDGVFPGLVWQPSLLAARETVSADRSLAPLRRIDLDGESWVDHAPQWISGVDRLFDQILTGRNWQQRSRHLFDRRVLEPRLTAP